MTKHSVLVLGWAVAIGVALFGCERAEAITVGPFGPRGQGGDLNGQNFTIGTGGQVHELDGFLYIQGLDLNGNLLGTTAQLSRDSLPTNLTYQFSFALSADAANIVLTYSFTNNSGATFTDVRFFVLLDAEIDETINTLFNEYGTVQGNPGVGGADPAPYQWQIDEPGFQTGTLVRNLYLGMLDNSNSIPATALNDVAMSLGFSLGDLHPGDGSSARVMISEAQHLLGSFALVQHDADPASTTVITMSGMRGQGQQVSAELAGTVFRDTNANGSPDAGEGLAGAVLLLQSNQVTVAQTTTDSSGRYTFTNAPGNYTLRLDTTSVPAGLLLIPVQSGATNNPWNVDLTANGVATVNWGFAAPPVGQVGGTVFRDLNGNGVPDAGEALSGAVLLLKSNQVTVAQTTTDSGGRYTFTNAPGNFTLSLDTTSVPAGLLLIPVQSGATNNPWNVALTANGIATVNWGFAPPPLGAILGTVFQDFNTNGVPDAGEPLRGVRLLLRSNQVTVAQTTTDGSGKYSFTNSPGNYLLQLDTSSLAAGLVQVIVQSGATNNPWNVSITANTAVTVNWGFRTSISTGFENVNSLLGYALSWQLNRARGTLIGTLSLTNLSGSGAILVAPWRLGMQTSANFFYPTNFGVPVAQLPDGNASVNLSAAMAAQSSQGQLSSGQFVVLTNAVEIYSLTRGAPPNSQFEIWASH